MTADTPKQAIEVDDYYDKVHQSTWTRRSAGVMAGATLGSAYGAALGALAAFIPPVLGALGIAGVATAALPELAVIASSAGILAAIGGLMGVGIVATVGANSAAVASGLSEKDKREQLEKLKESGAVGASANPELSIRETEDKVPPPFKWRTAVFTIPLFAAFGALIASNPVTAPLAALTTGTLGLSGTAAIAGTTGIFGMFGALFATPQSYYTNKTANFYLKVLKDKVFSQPEEHATVLSAKPEREMALAPESIVHEPETATRNFSKQTTRFSMQGLIEKTEDHSAGHHNVVTR